MRTYSNIFKFLCFHFLFVSFSQLTWSSNEKIPKKLLYGKYNEIEIIDNNDSIIDSSVKGFNIVFYQAKREWNLYEYFEPKDTLIRDTLIVYDHKFTIDSLILLESQYTGSYNLTYSYLTNYNKNKYIILVFFDGYQLGTDQQAIFVIFKILENEAILCSSYIENKNYPNSKIKLVKKRNNLFLKSRNIDRRI